MDAQNSKYQGAAKDKQGDIEKEEEAAEILRTICNKTGIGESKVIDILKWMAVQAFFSSDQLKTQFCLGEKNELRPLLSTLQTEGIAVRAKGFVMTAKGVRPMKLLLGGNGVAVE
jgi:hypothetical protein